MSRKTRETAREFENEVRDGHKGCGVEVPFDPAKAWGVSPVAMRPGRLGHPVHAQLNGRVFESWIIRRQRRFYLLLDEKVCGQTRASGA